MSGETIRDLSRRLRVSLAAFAAIAVLALLTAPAHAAFPGANGQIAFVSDRDPLGTGNSQVFVMGPNGENPTNVSNNPDNEEDPAFSPDGTQIALVGNPDYTEDRFPSEEIYVVSADGTNRRRLTRNLSDESEPAWSPDGTRIAFTYFSESSRGEEIHLMNADGSGKTTLLAPDESGLYSYSEPSWSPDGTRIAYTRSDPAGADVWVIDLASRVQTRLTESFEVESEPDFSPDGTRIAYVSDPYIIGDTKVVTNPDIWIMNADGSGKTRITSHPWQDVEPAFSPDGTRIAFTRRRPETDPHAFENFPGKVHVIDAGGGGDVNLTAGVLTGFLQDEESADDQPSWQPLGPGADRSPPAFTSTIAVPPVLALPARASAAASTASASRRARHRGTIRFRLSERASAKLAVERLRRGRKVKRNGRTRCVATGKRVAKRKRCTLVKLQGWLVRKGKRGRNRVRFSTRVGGKALKPGRYRIRAGAVDRRANPARQKRSRAFRVVR